MNRTRWQHCLNRSNYLKYVEDCINGEKMKSKLVILGEIDKDHLNVMRWA